MYIKNHYSKIFSYKNRIRIYLACALYILSRIFGSFSKKSIGKTRVIVFHHVDDPVLFRKIIHRISRQYNIISFQDYIEGRIDSKNINVIITMDDGYKSWLTCAFPIFQEYDVRPILFINSGFIGLDRHKAKDFCIQNINTWPEESLSWDDISLLAKNKCDIGGHTKEHENLLKTRHDIITKLVQERSVIGEKTKDQTLFFSYPYGLYNEEIAQKVKDSGYQFAFTSDSGFIDESKNNFQLLRTNIGLRYPLAVCALIEGWGDYVSKIVKKVKRVFSL